MEPLLWPKLLDYLLAPDFTRAVTSVSKSLIQLVTKEGDEGGAVVVFEGFKYITGPYAIFARLIVLAAVPFPEFRGAHVLVFLQVCLIFFWLKFA